MKTNCLSFISDWITEADKPNYRTRLFIRLSDRNNDGVCNFQYRVEGQYCEKGRWIFSYSGNDVDFVKKFFPAVVPYLDLDNCNFEGRFPLPIENGSYYLKTLEPSKAMEIFRVNEEEYHQLLIASEEKEFLAYQLNALGILKRWKKHADDFIALLERMTGNKWVNPYWIDLYAHKPVPFDDTVLSEQQITEIKEKISQGYYSEENLLLRKTERHMERVTKRKAEIITEYDNKIASLKRRQKLAISVLDAGILSMNYIFYDFKNEVVFNWRDSNDPISEKDFQEYVEKYGKVLFPEVKFIFKK